MLKPTKFGILALTISVLVACDEPVDQSQVSTVPVSQQQFSDAQNAAEICGRFAPDMDRTEQVLRSGGYTDAQKEIFVNTARDQRITILESPNSDTIVVLLARRIEGLCVVGLEGMTPEQSFQLALPWVEKFGALTNAERGQGLANNAVQAWASSNEDRLINIAAYRTFEGADVSGASVRLIYRIR